MSFFFIEFVNKQPPIYRICTPSNIYLITVINAILFSKRPVQQLYTLSKYTLDKLNALGTPPLKK